jgi:hypothetical protein
MLLSADSRTARYRFIIASAAIVVAVAFTFIAVNVIIRSSVLAQGPKQDGQSLMVRGYIAAQLQKRDQPVTVAVLPAARGKDIYLPDVDVFLSDPTTRQTSKPVKTDLSGRFTVFAPQRGRYQICWKSTVYGSGCNPDFVSAGGVPQFVSTVHITLPRRSGFVPVSGHVTQGDNIVPREFDALLNINAFAKIHFEDANGRAEEVFVNNFGDYLLPYVPLKQKFRVTATIESAKVSQEILPEANIGAAPFNQLNLKFENHRPRLDPLVALDTAGKRVQDAAPGSTIVLEAKARDLDGDPVQYTWSVGDGQGKMLFSSANKVQWQLPTTAGRHTITVVAYDGKGGYDKASINVLATGKGVPFGGVVIDTAGTPVAGAEIEIVSNATVKTEPSGRFNVLVKQSDRYVFNIHKEGYALNSQIYDRSVVGGRWILHRAQIATVDPTKPIHLVHERSPRDCPGPDSTHAGNGVADASLNIPEWQDGKGNIVDPPVWWAGPRKLQAVTVKAINMQNIARKDDQRVILPRQLHVPGCSVGVTVEIPPNSILDNHGNPATSLLKVAVSTVDLLSPQQMPGDDSVRDKTGKGGYIESFGAGSLDLPSGYKLKPGSTAKVTIPVDRSRLVGGALPPSVPLLSYDEHHGLWIEEGTLTLTTIAGRQSYIGDVKHFSAFNADNVKTADSACVRVFSPGLPDHYNLEVSAPYHGTGAPKVLTKQVDQDLSHENVIYNLPSNVNITLAPMTLGANPQLLGYYIVNSGNPQTPNTSPLPPPGPQYTSCQNFVVLKVGSAPNSPFGGEFLHGLGYIAAEDLGFLDLTSAAPTGNALKDAIVNASRQYYTSVDPSSLRTTFADFKSHNGLSADANAPAAGEIVAQYSNSGDLGFGRDMHCLKKVSGDVACYVTNYGTGYSNIAQADGSNDGTPDSDDAQAAETRSAVNQSHEVATVAMEYSPIEGDPSGNRVVKFFVYKKDFPSPGDYNRSISANLDGRGERPVPQLCMICHGGQAPPPSGSPPVPTFGSAAAVDLHARFLPFDYRFYTFADTAIPARTAAQWKSLQDANFKNLNEQIVNAAPPAGASDPIREVVSGLNNNGASPTQIHDFVVPGWVTGASTNAPGQQAFYTGVIANGCRSCHTAQPFPQLQFNTSDRFLNVSTAVTANNHLMLGTAQLRVCGDYTMPHALRTHDIFWNVYPWDVTNWGAPPGTLFPQQFQNFGNGIGGPTWKSGLCTSFLSTTVSSPSNFYEQSIQPIWNGKCVACHVSGGIAGFLNLTEGNSFSATVGGGLVTPPNDSNTSGVLLQRITGAGLESKMPLGCIAPPTPPGPGQLPCLEQSDIDKIKAWIRSGAN